MLLVLNGTTVLFIFLPNVETTTTHVEEVPTETVQTIEQTELTGMEPVQVIEPVYATEGDVSDVPEPEIVEFQITAPLEVGEPQPETRETTTIEVQPQRPKLTRQMSEKTMEIVSKGLEYMYELITKAIEEERELTVTEKEVIRHMEISQLETYIRKTQTVVTQQKFEIRKQQLIVEQQQPVETIELIVTPVEETPAESAPTTTVTTTQQVTLEGGVQKQVTTKVTKTSKVTTETKVIKTESPTEEYVIVEDVGFFPVEPLEEASESTTEKTVLRAASFTSSEEGYFTPEEEKPEDIVTTVEEVQATEQVTEQTTTETQKVELKTEMQTSEQTVKMTEEMVESQMVELVPEAPAKEEVTPDETKQAELTTQVQEVVPSEQQGTDPLPFSPNLW